MVQAFEFACSSSPSTCSVPMANEGGTQRSGNGALDEWELDSAILAHLPETANTTFNVTGMNRDVQRVIDAMGDTRYATQLAPPPATPPVSPMAITDDLLREVIVPVGTQDSPIDCIDRSRSPPRRSSPASHNPVSISATVSFDPTVTTPPACRYIEGMMNGPRGSATHHCTACRVRIVVNIVAMHILPFRICPYCGIAFKPIEDAD